jgi:hypothetical protein
MAAWLAARRRFAAACPASAALEKDPQLGYTGKVKEERGPWCDLHTLDTCESLARCCLYHAVREVSSVCCCGTSRYAAALQNTFLLEGQGPWPRVPLVLALCS